MVGKIQRWARSAISLGALGATALLVAMLLEPVANTPGGHVWFTGAMLVIVTLALTGVCGLLAATVCTWLAKVFHDEIWSLRTELATAASQAAASAARAAPKQHDGGHKRPHRRQRQEVVPATPDVAAVPDNVIPMVSPETRRAVRELVSDTIRRAEDNSEDKETM